MVIWDSRPLLTIHEDARGVYLDVSKTEKDMPKKLTIYIDGRSGARVREFAMSTVPVSTRTAKGLTVSKWPVKEVKRADLSLG